VSPALQTVQQWVAALAPTFSAAGAVVAAVGVVVAARTYRHSVRLRRAEWLRNLFQQYYEQERYRGIRYLLDYRPPRDIEPLHANLREDKCDSTVESLWDYLNFFEFVAGLAELNQLTERDVRLLFQYPLERIVADEEVLRAVDGQGFESLGRLLHDRVSSWKNDR
jgi:hypothetical protein